MLLAKAIDIKKNTIILNYKNIKKIKHLINVINL